MKSKLKELIFFIGIPLILGTLVGFATKNFINYEDIIKPSFTPDSYIFPIVWSILYLLMGISSYLIYNSTSLKKEKALFIYYLQLFVNLLWSFLFFVFDLQLFSFIWIILLIALVVIMIKQFYEINKTSAYLQIPYIIWLLIAAYLNLAIYILNR